MAFSVGFRGLGRWGRSNPNGIGSDSSPMFAGLSPAPGLLQRRNAKSPDFMLSRNRAVDRPVGTTGFLGRPGTGQPGRTEGRDARTQNNQDGPKPY